MAASSKPKHRQIAHQSKIANQASRRLAPGHPPALPQPEPLYLRSKTTVRQAARIENLVLLAGAEAIGNGLNNVLTGNATGNNIKGLV
jgi:hypothetical protein